MARHTLSAYICRRCTTALRSQSRPRACRAYSSKNDASQVPQPDHGEPAEDVQSGGRHAMSRRLEAATEDALFAGGRAGRRAVEDAGFSPELKERLLAKIADARFQNEHAPALAAAELPSSAPRSMHLDAAATPWTGTEAPVDTARRMLEDARKPLSSDLRGGRPRFPDLQPVDTRIRPEPKLSPGQKVAGAREAASAYAAAGDQRDEMRAQLRERLRPAARDVPATLTGLASLANERIEDAIARGQFRHIPRGKGIGTDPDARARNPFIDTTEYLMNNMIKRQEIVPPWIERQQELAKAVSSFRSRLRNDWTRHAARSIASKGGSLDDQVRRARAYARSEEVHNPRPRDSRGSLASSVMNDPIVASLKADLDELEREIDPESAHHIETEARALEIAQGSKSQSDEQSSTRAHQLGEDTEPHDPLLPPFRDPTWLRTEQSYLNVAVNHLNSLTRSYNLMAPELAKKSYFSLDRELNSCYADVAPRVPDAIRDRAVRRHDNPSNAQVSSSSILDRFTGPGASAKVYDSKSPKYGFREMWRDLFKGKEGSV